MDKDLESIMLSEVREIGTDTEDLPHIWGDKATENWSFIGNIKAGRIGRSRTVSGGGSVSCIKPSRTVNQCLNLRKEKGPG